MEEKLMFKKEDFKLQKKPLFEYIDKYGIIKVSEFCAIVGLPLIVAYEYLREGNYINNDEFNDNIKRLYEFYGIDKNV